MKKETKTMTKTNHYFRALAALALAASLLATLVKPAEAAFPDRNGNIAFSSNRSGNMEIYTRSEYKGYMINLSWLP